MTDAEKTKARIAKLLNMTVANGCTEDEQENAMRMAAGLATKLGIELDSLRPADAPKPKVSMKGNYTAMKVYESYCAEAAAALYGVECNAPNLGKQGYWFVGREDGIELAEKTMLWLSRQVDLLYKEALTARGRMTKRERSEFRASFKDACAQRVYYRALALMRKMKHDQSAAQEATGQNALVVANYFQTLEQEIDQFWKIRAYGSVEAYEAAMTAARERREAERARRAALTPEERAKEDRKLAREAAKAPRGRAGRSPKIGSGTSAGAAAAERVKLRQEVK